MADSLKGSSQRRAFSIKKCEVLFPAFFYLKCFFVFGSLFILCFDDYIKNNLQLCASSDIINMQLDEPAVVSRKHLEVEYPPWCGVLVIY